MKVVHKRLRWEDDIEIVEVELNTIDEMIGEHDIKSKSIKMEDVHTISLRSYLITKLSALFTRLRN